MRCRGADAKGTYGTVYRAVHIPTGDLVALKIVPIEEDEQDQMAEFLNEIEVASLHVRYAMYTAPEHALKQVSF